VPLPVIAVDCIPIALRTLSLWIEWSTLKGQPINFFPVARSPTDVLRLA